MFTLAACKQSTIPEINFIDCCLSSSDQHFSYIYDKSISEFSPSKDYVKCNIQGTSQRSWSFHLCKCESECYNNDPGSLQLHFHYWFSYLLTLPLCTGVSRVRASSPAWTGSPARGTLISRTISPQQKNQVQYNLDLHFAINISGNSPFGTPALMKNAERCEW